MSGDELPQPVIYLVSSEKWFYSGCDMIFCLNQRCRCGMRFDGDSTFPIFVAPRYPLPLPLADVVRIVQLPLADAGVGGRMCSGLFMNIRASS